MNTSGRVIINTAAARDDAAHIESIVSQITNDLRQLEESINKYIPEYIQTSWSAHLKEDWTSYYGHEIPAAMEEMKLSAVNLQNAVNEALRYSTNGQ